MHKCTVQLPFATILCLSTSAVEAPLGCVRCLPSPCALLLMLCTCWDEEVMHSELQAPGPDHSPLLGTVTSAHAVQIARGPCKRTGVVHASKWPQGLTLSLHTCRHRGAKQSEFYLSEDDLADKMGPAGSAYEAGPESLSFGGWAQEQRHAGRPRVGQLPGRATGTDGGGSTRCVAAPLRHLNCLGVICSFSKAETFPSLVSLSPVQLNHAQGASCWRPPAHPQLSPVVCLQDPSSGLPVLIPSL